MRAALPFLLMALSGCASVTRGTTENVTFDSNPPGATMRSTIAWDCPGGQCTPPSSSDRNSGPVSPEADAALPEIGPACITPCTIAVPRNRALKATFTKEGYEPEIVDVKLQVAGTGAAGFVGNAILGGVIGAAVDAGTGAALDHFPNPAVAIMRPIAPAKPSTPPKVSKKQRPES